ncbi:hypothetical protein F2Q68_00019626 [Brassica cretica]|uniref:Uncharacterized protein n=1 Tax=Brassica cretica TaxID=69181 RepID=A0A8S9FY55_BRACR|nr:hypothetical protein F2Q68_00019626 [Brassica cretica]
MSKAYLTRNFSATWLCVMSVTDNNIIVNFIMTYFVLFHLKGSSFTVGFRRRSNPHNLCLEPDHLLGSLDSPGRITNGKSLYPINSPGRLVRRESYTLEWTTGLITATWRDMIDEAGAI